MSDRLESKGLQIFMQEVAKELGVMDYEGADRSLIPPKVNGYVGGNTSRLLNELGQKIVSESSEEQIKELISRYDLHPPQEDVEKSTSIMNRFQ